MNESLKTRPTLPLFSVSRTFVTCTMHTWHIHGTAYICEYFENILFLMYLAHCSCATILMGPFANEPCACKKILSVKIKSTVRCSIPRHYYTWESWFHWMVFFGKRPVTMEWTSRHSVLCSKQHNLLLTSSEAVRSLNNGSCCSFCYVWWSILFLLDLPTNSALWVYFGVGFIAILFYFTSAP